MGNNNRNDRFSPPAVGGISLLVAFAVLCLTIFALLSLTTVQADVRLADASAEAVSNYYAADCQAQEILARLRNGEVPDGVTMIGSFQEEGQPDPAQWKYAYTYACPISERQELQVNVTISPDGSYDVSSWKAVSTGEWEIDEGLEIWDGEELPA